MSRLARVSLAAAALLLAACSSSTPLGPTETGTSVIDGKHDAAPPGGWQLPAYGQPGIQTIVVCASPHEGSCKLTDHRLANGDHQFTAKSQGQEWVFAPIDPALLDHPYGTLRAPCTSCDPSNPVDTYKPFLEALIVNGQPTQWGVFRVVTLNPNVAKP